MSEPSAGARRGRRRAVAAWASCAVLLLAACSDDALFGRRMRRCLDSCEASKDCPNAEPSVALVDCFTLCDDVEGVNGASDCFDEYDKLYACIDKHGVCETDTRCSDQQVVYADCIAEHCSPDPDRDECALP
jgi:hypothetical protein